MREIRLFLLILIWTNSKMAFGQIAQQPLKIGDQVPELEFTNLINSEKPKIKLSDYRGKLVILDFFATWCSPCVRALPRFDSLQREFKDQIVIIPITNEKEATVKEFLKFRPELNLSLPYVYATNLQKYFPYKLLPLEVWIDPTGKVIAQTDGEEVNPANIRKALKNDASAIQQKLDVLDRDQTKPFMAGHFGSFKFKPEQLLYTSIITSGFEGMPGLSSYVPIQRDGFSTLSVTNQFVNKLYWIALLDISGPFKRKETNEAHPDFYEKKEFYKKMLSRLVWEAKDSTLFWGRETKDIIGKKPWKDVCFNYELRMPETDPATFRKFMLQDLNRFFGLKYGLEGLIEKRKVKCYALQVVGPEELFKSKGGKSLSVVKKGVRGWKEVNTKIDDVMFWWLNFNFDPYFKYPIINETNYEGNIDFDLTQVDPTNFYEVNEGLKKFGLEFKLVERELDMIVIRDIK